MGLATTVSLVINSCINCKDVLVSNALLFSLPFVSFLNKKCLLTKALSCSFGNPDSVYPLLISVKVYILLLQASRSRFALLLLGEFALSMYIAISPTILLFLWEKWFSYSWYLIWENVCLRKNQVIWNKKNIFLRKIDWASQNNFISIHSIWIGSSFQVFLFLWLCCFSWN